MAEAMFPVRLACINHAASVRSEPGSNPSIEEKFELHATGETKPRRAGNRCKEPRRGFADQAPVAEPNPGRIRFNSRTILEAAYYNFKDRSPARSRALATHHQLRPVLSPEPAD